MEETCKEYTGTFFKLEDLDRLTPRLSKGKAYTGRLQELGHDVRCVSCWGVTWKKGRNYLGRPPIGRVLSDNTPPPWQLSCCNV
eukprot:8936340-Prorocentrum_lima.AAC.1